MSTAGFTGTRTKIQPFSYAFLQRPIADGRCGSQRPHYTPAAGLEPGIPVPLATKLPPQCPHKHFELDICSGEMDYRFPTLSGKFFPSECLSVRGFQFL